MSVHRQTTRRSRLGATALVAAACSLAVSSCSDTDRTAARFCTELQSQLPSLTAPLATSGDVDALVRRFEKLNGITPLAIEEEWRAVTDLVKMAADVVPNDPISLQELADMAYRAERPARDMALWVESTRGFDMPDVVGVEGVTPP